MTQLTAIAAAPTRTRPRIAARKWVVLVASCLGVFMVSLDNTIANVAFPAIQRSFPDSSTAALSWVLNAYTIAFAALLVVAGRTADRIGRRRVFFAGMAVFTLASIACGTAPSAYWLIGGRLVQGAGAAMVTAASLGLLLAAFPGRERAPAIALWGSFSAIATATGPTLGAVLVEGPGWRWVFFINVPVGVLTYILGRRVLTESRDESARRGADIAGVALITVAMGALALGIVQGGEWGWTSPRVLAAFVIVVLAVPLFVWRSFRTSAPVVDLRLFRFRSFAVGNTVMALYASSFRAFILANVLFLTSVWHYSVLRAGLAITPSPIAAAIAAPLAGRFVNRFGYRPPIVFGLTVTTACLIWLGTVPTATPDYLHAWLPVIILAGLGVGACFSLISGATVVDLPPAHLGVGGAVNQTARQLGSIIGVAVLVAILGTPSSTGAAVTAFHRDFLVCALFAGMAAITAMGLGRPRPAVAAVGKLAEGGLPDAA
jgi:EmrB/QacA subfamily drug resistance transporter